MKLPKYISVRLEGVTAAVKIKKWGIPIIAAKAMRKYKITPWYMLIFAWVWIYPKCCIRMMLEKGE